MPYRNVYFANDQIYHVFNRGVAKQPIFLSIRDYQHIIELLDYYRFENTPTSFSNFKKIPHEDRKNLLNNLKQENKIQVEIISFCLMPNHVHLLLKQVVSNGIKKFMANTQNSYAKYFNIKSKRVGPLYQSAFKAVLVESDEQLLHVSRYIHLNPTTSYLINKNQLFSYPWSSLDCYLDTNFHNHDFVATDLVQSFFKNKENFKQFITDQIDYQRTLDQIKHLTFE